MSQCLVCGEAKLENEFPSQEVCTKCDYAPPICLACLLNQLEDEDFACNECSHTMSPDVMEDVRRRLRALECPIYAAVENQAKPKPLPTISKGMVTVALLDGQKYDLHISQVCTLVVFMLHYRFLYALCTPSPDIPSPECTTLDTTLSLHLCKS